MSIVIGGDGPAAGAAAGDLVIEGSDQTFEQDVLITSQTTPVIVDFWAPWCGPCRQLGPALEQAVTEANGKVKLVKINVDEHQAIGAQLRVQSIPAVFAFAGGRPVDGFVGALPASEIKKFVERLAAMAPAGDPLEELLSLADDTFAQGDTAGAAQLYSQALDHDGTRAEAIAGLARCYLASNDVERAREVLDTAPPDSAKHPSIDGVRAALELASNSADSDELAALRSQVEADPKDFAARLDLAKALAGNADFDGAAEHLFEILLADINWNDGAAKAELLTVFEAAGPTSPVTVAGRRRLSTLMFA